jgi:structural maintenance of chromosome 4
VIASTDCSPVPLPRSVHSAAVSREAANSAQNVGSLYAALDAQKKRGHLKGMFGRMGTLGAIDDKYDVAITTAASGGLRAVLVDDVEAGEEVIAFAKAKELGVVDCLALRKMAYSAEAMARPATPESVPRLFDLIRVKDPAFLPAFYHVLRDTLVANDLDQAMRIAETNGKRWRVVTLDGQVIEIAGTMSGGKHTRTGTRTSGNQPPAHGLLRRRPQ